MWIVSALSFGWFVIRGNVASTTNEGRKVILLEAHERALVLGEMRTMLASSQQIIQGLASNDRMQIQKAAKAAGMGSAIDLDPVFIAKLPIEFKTFGFSMHSDMDAIAQAIEKQAPNQQITQMLANTMTKCVACHASWEIQSK